MLYGIDISSNNPNYESIDTRGLDFAIVKVTQGDHYTNPLAPAQCAWGRARGLHVGVYHWTEPWIGAEAQAAHFANAVGTVGAWTFWCTDNEDSSRPVGSQSWAQCVASLIELLKAKLGPRRLTYGGAYFHEDGLRSLEVANNWWLPNYGNDDGNVHPLPAGQTPVVHQYSSHGGLDRNVVLDERAFAAVIGGSVPTPPVTQSHVHPTVRLGDHSFAVKQAQVGMDVGCSQHLTPDGVFGPATLAAVKAVQKFFHLTPDGIVGPQTWSAIDFCYFTHGGK